MIFSKEGGELSTSTISIPHYTAISIHRKYFILFLVSFSGFLGPFSGNIYIPLLKHLSIEFNVSESAINGTVSCFMVVFAIFPIFWSSISDYGGRKFLYVIALVIYIASNILLSSLPKHLAILYVFRVFQAIGVSTMSVGMGVVADIFELKERGKVVSYFMLGPQSGPVLGPLASVIGARHNWRWIFGFLAILGALDLSMILFLLPETLRCLVGDCSYLNQKKSWMVMPKFKQQSILSEKESVIYPHPPKPSLKIYAKVVKQINVILCTITGSLAFSSFYAILTTFGSVLENKYGYTSWKSCLSYLCPGISMILGSLATGHLTDYIRKEALDKKRIYIPEYRFSFQIVGTLLLMIGLIGYGWCVEKRKNVVSIFVLVALSSIGSTSILNCNTTYLLESSTKQPATFVAIGNAGRNVGAAISSAIVNPLVSRMGYGWCFTGMGFVCLFSALLTCIHIWMGIRAKTSSSLRVC